MDSQSIKIMEGFISLILSANEYIEPVLGKPLDFNGDAFYGDDVIGIYVMSSGDSAPSITLTAYMANPNVAVGLMEYAVQVRVRSDTADYRPAMFILDTLREVDEGIGLNGLTHTNLGGYNCPIMTAQSLGDMGVDDNHRYELTENYYLILDKEPGEING